MSEFETLMSSNRPLTVKALIKIGAFTEQFEKRTPNRNATHWPYQCSSLTHTLAAGKFVWFLMSWIFIDVWDQFQEPCISYYLTLPLVSSAIFITNKEINAQKFFLTSISDRSKTRVKLSWFTVPSCYIPCSCKSTGHLWTQIAWWAIPTTWQDLQSQGIKGQQGYLKYPRPRNKKFRFYEESHCSSCIISIEWVETSLQNTHMENNLSLLSKFNMNLKIDTLKKGKCWNPIDGIGGVGEMGGLTSTCEETRFVWWAG